MSVWVNDMDDFALALKLAKEEEDLYKAQKQREEEDARLAMQLQKELEIEEKRVTAGGGAAGGGGRGGAVGGRAGGRAVGGNGGGGAVGGNGAGGAVGRGKVGGKSDTAGLKEKEVKNDTTNDQAIARTKQSFYCTWVEDNLTDPSQEKATGVEAEAAGDDDDDDEDDEDWVDETANDEAIAKVKQSLYCLAEQPTRRNPKRGVGRASVAQNNHARQVNQMRQNKNDFQTQLRIQSQIEQEQERLRQQQQQQQQQQATATPPTSATTQQPLSTGPLSGVDEIHQILQDAQLAEARQSNYFSQFNDHLAQLDSDETFARHLENEPVVPVVYDDSQFSYHHQRSIHNLNCKCGSVRDLEHVFLIHDRHCGCHRTHVAVVHS